MSDDLTARCNEALRATCRRRFGPYGSGDETWVVLDDAAAACARAIEAACVERVCATPDDWRAAALAALRRTEP